MSTPESPARYSKSPLTDRVSGFAAQYREMLDSQLLQLAEEREGLLPDAAAALEAELTLRGISGKQRNCSQDDTGLSETERNCPLCGVIYNANWQARL